MATHVYKYDLVDIDLNSGTIFRSFVNRAIGTGDNQGDRFGVFVYRNGEPEDLTDATCIGFFRDPMGNNIEINGHIGASNRSAYVVLPQACYNYEGAFTLTIKLIANGVTSTVRIVDGTVANTHWDGAVAPTGAVPTYQEVLAVYDQMQSAVEEVTGFRTDIENMQADIEEWEAGSETKFLEAENKWYAGDSLFNVAINAVTGETYEESGYITSDYIPVNTNDIVYMNGGNRYYFYDGNKAAISGATGNYNNLPELISGTGIRYVIAPLGAAYFRICINTATFEYAESFLMIATPIEKHLLNSAGSRTTAGFKYYALGDSITKGMYANEGSSSSTGKTDYGYPYWIAQDNVYTLVNLGVSGSGYVKLGTPEAGVVDDDSENANAVDVVDDNSFSDADLISLAWGINDYKGGSSIHLGSVASSTAGDGTVIGNMKYCIETLITKAPKANIIILLPMNQNRFMDTNEAQNWSFGKANEEGKTLTDYRNELTACAEYYNLKIVDPETLTAINRKNIRSCLGDGLHPTIPFYRKMGAALVPFIR